MYLQGFISAKRGGEHVLQHILYSRKAFTSGALESLFCQTKRVMGIESKLVLLKKKNNNNNPEIQSLYPNCSDPTFHSTALS